MPAAALAPRRARSPPARPRTAAAARARPWRYTGSGSGSGLGLGLGFGFGFGFGLGFAPWRRAGPPPQRACRAAAASPTCLGAGAIGSAHGAIGSGFRKSLVLGLLRRPPQLCRRAVLVGLELRPGSGSGSGQPGQGHGTVRARARVRARVPASSSDSSARPVSSFRRSAVLATPASSSARSSASLAAHAC